MNDFFLADNRTFQIGEIEAKQIQVKSLDLFCRHAETIKEYLKDKDYSDEILIELFKAHTVEVIQVCVMTTNLTADRIFDVAKDQALFLDMLRAVLTVNTAYFKPEKPKRGAKKQATESTWFDSFQFLVSMGHQHSEVMEMTYGAFQGYVKAANKMYKQGIFNSAIAARVAQSDKKGFESFKKEMVSD